MAHASSNPLRMPEGTAPDRAVIEEAARAAADRAMNQHKGNAINALRRAMRENEEQRIQIADLERELGEAKKKAPADGTVVLTADESKEWQGFKALGKSAKDVTSALGDFEKLLTDTNARTFEEAVAKAALELGWNKHALPALLTSKHLAAELRDVVVETDEGRKTEKLLHVRPGDNDKAPWEIVDVYVAREFPDWIVILESTPPSTESDTGGEDDTGGVEDTDAAGEPTMRATNQNGRRSAYRAARDTNGGGMGKGNDGVRFPAQRNPTPRSRITKKELQDLAEQKNRTGEYNAF